MKAVVVQFVAVVLLASCGNGDAGLQGESESPPQPTNTPSPASQAPTLRLEPGWACTRSSASYMMLGGQVTNTGETTLQKVSAIATYRTQEGAFVAIAEDLIDQESLRPSATSPFSVLVSYDPAMIQCSVTFRFFGGAFIDVEEAE